MTDSVVTWGDLIKIVLFLLGTGVLFYLLLAVANLVGILKNINKMLETNRTHINSSLEKLPEITNNVTKISDIVKDEMENIQKVMGNVGKISDSAKDAVEMIKKDILVKAKNILDIIDWIKKLFQDKGGKKKEIIYKYRYKPADETVVEEIIEGNEQQKNEESTKEVGRQEKEPVKKDIKQEKDPVEKDRNREKEPMKEGAPIKEKSCSDGSTQEGKQGAGI